MSQILTFLEETQISFQKGTVYSHVLETEQETVAIFKPKEYKPYAVVLASNFPHYLEHTSSNLIGQEDDPKIIDLILKDCIEFSPNKLKTQFENCHPITLHLNKQLSFRERLQQAVEERDGVLADIALQRAMDANPDLYKDVHRPMITYAVDLNIDNAFDKNLTKKQIKAQELKARFTRK